MNKINPAHITALMDLMNRGPYYRLLAMRLLAVDWGRSTVAIELQNDHLNPFGIVHGGALASLIDTAAYWSVYCELAEGAGLTTIDLQVNYLNMATTGRIVAEGRSIKVGRSICLATADVRDAAGKLLAQGTAKMLVLAGRQSIQTAMAELGQPDLPPKYC